MLHIKCQSLNQLIGSSDGRCLYLYVLIQIILATSYLGKEPAAAPLLQPHNA